MPLFGASGSRIGYEVHEGPAGAPPLLLLHGFTASSACWVSNLPGLCDRFTAITVDLLGHGQSDAPDDPELYGPQAAISRITALLDHLGYDSVLVCGHSLGGALALRLALDAPERVAGLAILNSNSAAGTPEWREAGRAAMQAMAEKARAEGTAFLRETRLYPASGTRLPQDARDLLTRDFDQLTTAGFACTAEALVIEVNAFERLGALQVPTLVMIGDRDADFVQSAPRFVVRIAHTLVDTVTIEGAGHAANLEQPAAFNGAVIAFAEQIGYLAESGGTGAELPLIARHGDTDAAAASAADEDLGPSLYAELGAGLRERGARPALTVAGVGLIAIGAVLIVAAFVVGGRDNNGATVAAGGDGPGAPATATPTAIEQAAGVRTAATPSPTSTAAAGTAPAGATPSAVASATPRQAAIPGPTDEPAPGGDSTPAATPTRVPTVEPTPMPTPVPTVEPTAEPTAEPTPTGPWVSIGGPSSGDVGASLTFSSTESNGAVTRVWSASNGARGAHVVAFTVTFESPGCHTVTVTALFPGGQQTSTQVVAVGVENC